MLKSTPRRAEPVSWLGQDLSADQLALIAAGGRVPWPKLLMMPGDSGGTRIIDGAVTGAVLEIIVEP